MKHLTLFFTFALLCGTMVAADAVITPAQPPTGPIIAVLTLLAAAAFFLTAHLPVRTQTKTMLISLLIVATLLFGVKLSTPTGLTTQPIAPQNTTQCTDGTDNDNDGLVDCNDPGCHSDGNPANNQSCISTDNYETDTLEYDRPPTADGHIDIFDVVNWARYAQGNTTVLVHCTNATCTNQAGTANCIGDTDPNNDNATNITDLRYLERAELNDTNSTGICTPPQ